MNEWSGSLAGALNPIIVAPAPEALMRGAIAIALMLAGGKVLLA